MLGQGMHRGCEFDFKRHPSGDSFELGGIELFSTGRPAWAAKTRAINMKGLSEERIA